MIAASSSRLPLPEALIRHHAETLESVQQEWVRRGSVPQVLLFTGPPGIGKRSLCTWLAQWILCRNSPFSPSAQSPQSGETSEDAGFDLFGGIAPEPAPAATPSAATSSLQPCGECPACRRALDGNWVDFAEILPEEDSETLKIEQFRDLKASMGFSAHEGAFRIFLIPDIERMTTQAANSVLKLLEEPPRGWVLFLTASDASMVLPTVRSRCQMLRLRPLSRPTLLNLLESSSVPASRRATCVDLAQGSWGKALRLGSDDAWNQRRMFFDFLKSPQSTLNTLVDWASQDLNQFRFFLDQLESITADLLNLTLSGAPACLNQDGQEAMTSFMKKHAPGPGELSRLREFLLKEAETISRTRQEAQVLNRKILAQQVLLPWLEPFRRD